LRRSRRTSTRRRSSWSAAATSAAGRSTSAAASGSPSYPDRDVRGYHIPKLLIPGRRTLALVVENSRKTKDYQRTAFFTRDLGEPYAPAEGRLSLEQVQACVRGELRPVDPWGVRSRVARLRTMGVDVARKRALNVVIEEEVDYETSTGVKLWVGEIEDDPARGPAIDQLGQLMVRFGVHMARSTTRRMGGCRRRSRAVPGPRVPRVVLHAGPAQKQAPAPMNVDDAEMFVSLWRTRAYDATFERFRMQRVLLPPLESLPRDYPAHLGNLYRQKTERRQELALMLGQGPVPLMDLVGGPGEDDEDDVDPGEALTGVPGYRSGFE
jgi:hypothetical protein